MFGGKCIAAEMVITGFDSWGTRDFAVLQPLEATAN